MVTVWGHERLAAQESSPGSEAVTPQLPLLPTLPEPQEFELPAEPSLSDLVRIVILDALPDEYVDERHWGQQAERFSGIRVRGLQVSVREKLVNHGFWRRFTATLDKPEDNLQVQIVPWEQPLEGRKVFDIQIVLRAHTTATFANWVYGVKGLNGTVRSAATLQANIRLLAAPQARLSWGRLVPQVGLDIQVANVDLQVRDLDVSHIGFFGGWLAEQLGDGSRQSVEALVNLQERRIMRLLQQRLDRLKLNDPAGETSQPSN